jgi:hypothetical protein
LPSLHLVQRKGWRAKSTECTSILFDGANPGGTKKAIHERTRSALNHRFKFKKNYQCGKMLRQDRDFSSIDAGNRQFDERWRREKNSVIYMGLISGPNKADDTCGKTTNWNDG